MKKSTLILLFLIPITAWSQDNITSFTVHEDRVKPSMVAQYETAANNLLAALKEHNIEGPSWLAATTEDFRYLYVSKMSAMADLDKNLFAPLAEKIGSEAFGKLFQDLDKCYDTHGDYVLHLDSELSYMPEGLTQTPEGQPYRRFYYVHSSASNWSKLLEHVKAHKKLSEEKGSKWYYRVYRAGYGTMGNYIMVAAAGKDALDFETRRAEMVELLGDARHNLMQEMSADMLKFESYNGQVRPDLSYGL